MPTTPLPVDDQPRLDDPTSWRQTFDAPAPMTIGVEDEVMVCDAGTLDLAGAGAALAAATPDPRVRPELPAAQLELVTGPVPDAATAAAELAALRVDAARTATERGLRLAAAGVHPFAPAAGTLNEDPRYARIAREYGPIAVRQLVFGLHVHVCVRGADRVLAVYNALREHLPLLAALAAHAPWYAGQDTGLASVRPSLSGLLPRQGVPPALSSWEHVADVHRFGRASGRVPDAASWWWEARLHPTWGTLEVRVCDAQATAGDAGALAGVVHALVAWLADRHDARDLPEPAETWRIAENRWSAARWGVHGLMVDPRTGAPQDTAAAIAALLHELARPAEAIGATAALARAARMLALPPADRLRAIAAEAGPRAAVADLADRFALVPAR